MNYSNCTHVVSEFYMHVGKANHRSWGCHVPVEPCKVPSPVGVFIGSAFKFATDPTIGIRHSPLASVTFPIPSSNTCSLSLSPPRNILLIDRIALSYISYSFSPFLLPPTPSIGLLTNSTLLRFAARALRYFFIMAHNDNDQYAEFFDAGHSGKEHTVHQRMRANSTIMELKKILGAFRTSKSCVGAPLNIFLAYFG